ncbi:hypothetical protein DPMN_006473 [Dreissena polymorpha]|uniref:Uncharacterized protein n=1 Tax=Dreissena polymorpha TaxID=45954 RepID=A0A9D4MRI0_DREPO|nr:hypothetical protein DPMN_006473 [Dreissena polymorpha]
MKMSFFEAFQRGSSVIDRKKLLNERWKNKLWVTTENMGLYDKRRELTHEKYMHTSNDIWSEYQKANRELRKELKEAKKECIEEKCIIISQKKITFGRSK